MVVRHNTSDKEINQPLKQTPNHKTLKPKEFLKSNSNVKANEKSTKELKSTSKSVNVKSTISKSDKPIKNAASNTLKPTSITKKSIKHGGKTIANKVVKSENPKSLQTKSASSRNKSKSPKITPVEDPVKMKSESSKLRPKSITEKSIKYVGKTITNKVSKSDNLKSDMIIKSTPKRIITKSPPSLKVKESNKSIEPSKSIKPMAKVPTKSKSKVATLSNKPKVVQKLESKDLNIGSQTSLAYSRPDTDFFAEYVVLCDKFNQEKLQSLELMNLREFTINVFTEHSKDLKDFVNNIENTIFKLSKEVNMSTKEIFNTLRETIRNPERFKVTKPKDHLQKLQHQIVQNIKV